jgi:hypothetical protein
LKNMYFYAKKSQSSTGSIRSQIPGEVGWLVGRGF